MNLTVSWLNIKISLSISRGGRGDRRGYTVSLYIPDTKSPKTICKPPPSNPNPLT